MRPGEADNPVSGLLVGFAHGACGPAFAGSGQAVDDRQTFLAGRMAEGAGLLAADPVKTVAVQHLGALLLVKAVRLV